MDENLDLFSNFESVLKNRPSDQPHGLYRDKKLTREPIDTSELLSNFSKEIRALQRADYADCMNRSSKTVVKPKKSQFLPVNMLPKTVKASQQKAQFETQGISDSQLMNVVQDAEAVDPGGMTEEFDTTFHHEGTDIGEDIATENSTTNDTIFPIIDISLKEPDPPNTITKQEFIEEDLISKENVLQSISHQYSPIAAKENFNKEAGDSLMVDNNEDYFNVKNITNNADTIKIENNDVMIFQKTIDGDTQFSNDGLFEDIIKDSDFPSSPILDTKPKDIKTGNNPLVFNLDMFETFESMALPVIEESPNFETAKQLINSRICGNELIINTFKEPLPSNTDSHFKENNCVIEKEDRISPIMPLSEEIVIEKYAEVIRTPKTVDEAENNIVEDEILFSSDEETEKSVEFEVNREHQDLPLTCALETSFYEQIDVLDKTMYVAFQTASNKSIQILSESLSKAKSILVDDLTEDKPLEELVKECEKSVAKEVEIEEMKQGPEVGVQTLAEIVNNCEKSKKASETSQIKQESEVRVKTLKTLCKNNMKSEKLKPEVFPVLIQSQEEKGEVTEEEMEIFQSQILPFDDSKHKIKRKKQLEQSKQFDINIKDEDKKFNSLDIKHCTKQDLSLGQDIEMKSKHTDIFKQDTGLIPTQYLDSKMEICNSADPVTKNTSTDYTTHETNETKVEYLGFKTASEKAINVSDNAFAKSKDLLSDLIEIKPGNKQDKNLDKIPSLLEDSLNNAMEIQTTRNTNYKEDTTLADAVIPENIKQTEINLPFVGFKTANNKEIKISTEALEKTSKVFCNIDSEDLIQAGNKRKANDFPNVNFAEPKVTKKVNDDINVRSIDFENSAINMDDCLSVQSSETEIFKPEELNDTIFEEFENDIFIDSPDAGSDVGPPFYGFESENNEEVRLYEEAMARVISEFETESVNNTKSNSTTDTCFETSSNANNFQADLQNEISDSSPNIAEDHTKILKNSTPQNPTQISSTIESGDAHNISNLNDILGLKLSENFPFTKKFLGFQTASNKPVQISSKALAKTKAIFQDIDTETNPKDLYENTSESFQGFQTASKKPVTISAKALARTKKVFQDIDANLPLPESFNTVSTSQFQGFQTASNKEVKISKEALKKPNMIFQDIDVSNINKQNCNEDVSSKGFQGFVTASNKPVRISSKALAKSKKIFEDIADDKMKEIFKQPYRPLQKRDGNFADKSKVNVQNMVMTEDTELHLISHENTSTSSTSLTTMPATSVFQGFQTASNKRVKISEEALARSKKLFQDITPIPDTALKGFPIENNTDIKMSEESLANIERYFQDIDDKYLKTKSSTITRPEMQRHKTTEEIEYSYKNNATDIFVKGKNIGQNTFSGFQTASKKKVEISERALAMSRKIFEASEEKEKKPFKGFQTASNKKVKISEAALASSRKLFREFDDTAVEVSKPVGFKDVGMEYASFQGFQTASKKEVKISENALAKSRKLFQEFENTSAEVNKPVGLKNLGMEHGSFQGFKTASKKEVKISETALAKSRKLFHEFEDIGMEANKPSGYQGFQTASKKEVTISETALAKSRKLFQEFEDTDSIKLDNSRGFRGFETASNKIVKISESALLKIKHLFDGITESAHEKDIVNKNTERFRDKAVLSRRKPDNDELGSTATEIVNEFAKDKKNDFECTVDTQVINNFDESLHTEDFKESPSKMPKRSGSPILSCPKAKKRKKFEIPYSQRVLDEKVSAPTNESPKAITVSKYTIDFDTDYKNNKKYNLIDIQRIEKENTSIKPEIDKFILNFTFEALPNFEFCNKRNDISDDTLNIENIKRIFLQNSNEKLIPHGWLDIQIPLILWKLMSYEIKFPKSMQEVTTARNLLNQLKYRYNRELYNAERPALRKIMEKDDISSKTLVLCVVGVVVDGSLVTSIPPNHTTLELLLTDGWYTIKAVLDRMLTKLVTKGIIHSGCKIVTNGAELVGTEQGVSPWEDTSAIRLKLSGNSTRPARWHSRLGYHASAAILTRLSSVNADGGKISKLRVHVARVYPALYVEKFEDGSTVTRSERLEHLHQMRYESDRQALMEKLYEEVEKEELDQDSQESDGLGSGSKRKCLDSGSQIAKMMKSSKDPNEFRSRLTASQTTLLEDHSNRERERLIQQIQTRVQDKMDTLGLRQGRNVVPVLKVRVADVTGCNDVTKAFLSIWKPNDAILEIIKEGAWIEILNVVPTGMRYSEIQLSAGRSSIFSQSKQKVDDKVKLRLQPLKRTCYTIKDLVSNPSMTIEYNEIDTVGFVFQIDPPVKEFESSKHQFQNLYLSDADRNLICVNFWGGLKKFGFENVIDTGQIVACTNLQKRAGNTRKSIPQFRVTEFSYFTKTPKNDCARKIVEELSKIFLTLDKIKFIQDCINLKQNFATVRQNYIENVSPYRMPNIDVNASKNKVFVDSPLAKKKSDDNFNLTGLDFESTFKQESQEWSPRTLLRKQQIKDKIAKLKMYGEPPALSPMQILNKSKYAASAYKSPFSKSDLASSVANSRNLQPNVENSSVKETVENKDTTEIPSSPVIMNRTFVKRVNVNPVKLNFDENQEVDNFAEEFDSSPPLSLD